MSTHRIHLGQGLAHIPDDVSGLALVLSRREVSAHHIGRCTDDLLSLSDDTRLTRQLAHGLYLMFDGYDSDPREIADIPECRAFLQALHQHWPYWMHFLAPLPEQWALVLACLLPDHAKPTGDTGSTPHGARAIDAPALRDLLIHMTLATNRLHDHHAIAEQEAHHLFMSSSQAIAASIGSAP